MSDVAWLAPYLKSKSVLDPCAGVGYHAFILSEFLECDVCAVDNTVDECTWSPLVKQDWENIGKEGGVSNTQVLLISWAFKEQNLSIIDTFTSKLENLELIVFINQRSFTESTVIPRMSGLGWQVYDSRTYQPWWDTGNLDTITIFGPDRKNHVRDDQIDLVRVRPQM